LREINDQTPIICICATWWHHDRVG